MESPGVKTGTRHPISRDDEKGPYGREVQEDGPSFPYRREETRHDKVLERRLRELEGSQSRRNRVVCRKRRDLRLFTDLTNPPLQEDTGS